MAHKHSIYDTDPHFTIDATTREIKNQSEEITVMQSDHNAERFTFEMPRYIEGHDMSLCNKVRVHYNNVKSDRSLTNRDVYVVDDMQLSPDSEDVVIFSWLLSRNATKHNGTLNFVVVFSCIADDGKTVDYEWRSAIYKGYGVGESIENGEVLAEDYPDILGEFKASLATLSDEGDTVWDKLDDLTAQKETLATSLTDGGVEVGEGETYTTLVPKAKGMLDDASYYANFHNVLSANGTNFTSLFRNNNALKKIPYVRAGDITDFTEMFYYCSSLTELEGLDTSSGTNFYKMFGNCSKLTTVPPLDTSSGTNFSHMFYGCSKLTTVPPLDTSNGTSFYNMFGNCSKLTTVPPLDTSNGGNFSNMFSGCSKLTTVPPLDMSNGYSVHGMFYNCSELTTVSNFDMSKATDFGYSFGNCSKLTTISNVDTSSGTDFSNAFENCSSLTEIPDIDMSKGTNFSYTFSGCEGFTEISDVSFPNGTNLSYMFYNCNNLTKVSNWYVPSATTILRMFSGCYNLVSVEGLDTSNGTNFSYMFYDCTKLVSVEGLDTSNGTNFSYMFYDCRNLETIDGIDFSGLSGTLVNYWTRNCTKLANVTVNGTIPKSISISYCTALSVESAKSFINALVDYSGTSYKNSYTITFASNVKTALTNEGATSPNGNTWLDYITDKGWKY